MRVEPFGVDSIVHVMKRGARGLPITRDASDMWRFVRLLYYANDQYKDDSWERETAGLGIFHRPTMWPERIPLVKILGWVLMPNHFHLLLREISDGGISKFMQKLCGSMSTHFNKKYQEKGSLFQGAYKGRTIHDNSYLQQIVPYIMVKNVFELYPGGYSRAVREFDKAWHWAVKEYKFSSLADYADTRISPILEKDILHEVFSSPGDFREHAKEVILNRTVDEISGLPGILFNDELTQFTKVRLS